MPSLVLAARCQCDRASSCCSAPPQRSAAWAGVSGDARPGKSLTSEFAPVLIATRAHRHLFLRAPDEGARAAAFAAFVEDLKVAARSAKLR